MGFFKAIIHVSTAYANCNQEEIGEKFYDMPFKFEDLDRIVSKLDAAAVDDITPKWVFQTISICSWIKRN